MEHGGGNRVAVRRCRRDHGASGRAAAVWPHHWNVAPRHHRCRWILDPYMGAPGLLLSTPITACLVVLGRHVESLNFIELLLGDKPPLSPVQSFYQRILASDPDEVIFQAESLLKDLPLLDYYEQVALPGLTLAQIDVVRGVMERSRQVEICESVERVVADLADHVDVRDEKIGAEPAQIEAAAATDHPPATAALCLAGRTPIDQAACS